METLKIMEVTASEGRTIAYVNFMSYNRYRSDFSPKGLKTQQKPGELSAVVIAATNGAI